MKHRIFPLGDNALTIDFGNEISVELNDRVIKLARFFDRNPFAGLIEVVPAYSSLTIFYDVLTVRKNHAAEAGAFAAVEGITERALENFDEAQETTARLVEIPICFDADLAPDLEFVAAENCISSDLVVEIFLGRTYRVFMLGFLPGFSYMGKIDDRIATPRKTVPRSKVPRGSVGIAGKQTGIYSLESPGGWQIIGRTPLELFTPEAESPAFLRAGDDVKFYPIDKAFFEIKINSGSPLHGSRK